jgi:peptidoglycan/LPS O-acetylase OafA/YrhL
MSTAVIQAEEHMSKSIPKKLGGRLPELDGLRGMAIGMVLFYHYISLNSAPRPGSVWAYALIPARLTWSGVDLFFVLSGFLIGGILLDARDSSNYFRVFYTRRFFRIIPMYALFLVSIFALDPLVRQHFVSGTTGALADRIPWYSCALFLQNFAMAFKANMGPSMLGIIWSLAIEEQFYLTLPFLVRVLDKRRLLMVIGVGIFLAPAFRIVFFRFWPAHSWSWIGLMPCRADTLLLGVLGAIGVRDAGCLAWLQGNRRQLQLLLGGFAAGAAYLVWRAADTRSFLMVSAGFTWLALFYLVVLLYAITDSGSWLSRSLRVWWLMWLGSIAYGAYLFHGLVFVACAIFIFDWRGPILRVQDLGAPLLALVGTLVLCRVSWRYFEKPLVRMGHRTDYLLGNDPAAVMADLSAEAPGAARA